MATDSSEFADKAISAYMQMAKSAWIGLASGTIHEQERSDNIMNDEIRWHGYDSADIYDAQNTLLKAIADGRPLMTDILMRTPPDRAAILVRIAERAGVPLERGTYSQILEACELAGSDGKLVAWWTL